MPCAVDLMGGDQKSPQPDSQNLRKTFRELKIYTSKLAEFVLQWQDLEDHFLLIKTQVEQLEKTQRINTHQSFPLPIESLRRRNGDTVAEPSIQSQNKNPESEIEACERELSVLPKNENPESEDNFIPIDSGKSLVVYLNEHVKEHNMLRNAVCKVLKAIPNPGKLVLEALRLFYPSDGMSIDLSVTRKSCLLLLEQLNRVLSSVDSQVRKEALEMALDWESKMKNSLEVLGFLMLVAGFKLVDEFNKHGILKHFDKVVQLEQAPKLFRASGFADKAQDLIQKLIKKNKRLEAIPFIYAFGLVDKFPPVPLLKAHSEFAEETYKKICNRGKNSLTALDNATGTQIAALRGILKWIKKYKLHLQYSPEIIRARIMQLKKQRDEKKASETFPPNTVLQPQVEIGDKRNISSMALSNQHDTCKRARTAVVISSASDNTVVNSKQASVFSKGEDWPYFSGSTGRTGPGLYFSQSSGRTALAANTSNASTSSATLTHHSTQFPRVHSSNFISGQVSQQLISPSGLYSLAGSSSVTMPSNFLHRVNGTVGSAHAQEPNPISGQYGSSMSSPFNGQFTSLIGPYGSSFIPQMSSPVSQYHSSVTNRETGQLGLARFSYTNRHHH